VQIAKVRHALQPEHALPLTRCEIPRDSDTAQRGRLGSRRAHKLQLRWQHCSRSRQGIRSAAVFNARHAAMTSIPSKSGS